jgi:hypothetical protein
MNGSRFSEVGKRLRALRAALSAAWGSAATKELLDLLDVLGPRCQPRSTQDTGNPEWSAPRDRQKVSTAMIAA